MVDTTKASESTYMTTDTVRESPTKKAAFIDEGEYTQQEYKGKVYEKFEITVQIDGKTKTYAPNKDTVKNIQAQTVVSASANVKPIGSNTAGTAILAATAGKFATLVSDGTNWIIMQAN